MSSGWCRGTSACIVAILLCLALSALASPRTASAVTAPGALAEHPAAASGAHVAPPPALWAPSSGPAASPEAAAVASHAAARQDAGPLSFRRALAGRLGRLAVYGALFIAIGAIGMSVIVVPRLRAANTAGGDAYPMVLDGMSLSVGVVAGFLLALAILTRTLLQYSDFWEVDPSFTMTMFLATVEGRALASSTLLGIAVAVSSAMARSQRDSRMWRLAQVIGVVVFLHFWTYTGNAAGAGPLLGLPRHFILVIHMLAAGLWLGLPAVIFVTVLPVALRDSARLPLLRAAILSFTGVAMVSASVVVLTGVINTITFVGFPPDFMGTLYGRTLLLKVAVVIPLLAVGAYNWRFLHPHLHSIVGALKIRSTIRLELLLAAIVLAITAVLVVTTPPL